jgi:hypothetical protein
MTRALAVALFAVAFSGLAFSQTVTTAVPASDPQALALAAQSVAALDGATQINDVVLSGIATEMAGGYSASGTATLKARGYQQSRYDNSGSQRREIKTIDANGDAQGQYTDFAGSAQPQAGG